MALDPALMQQLMGGGGMPGAPAGPPDMGMAPPGGPPPPGMPPPMDPMAMVPPPPPMPTEPDWSQFDPDEMVKEIPLTLGQEARILEWCHDEIERSARFLQKIHKEIRDYREQVAEFRRPKNFPWEKCSNVAVPMTAPAVNQVAGRNIKTLRATDPLVVIEPMPGVEDKWRDPELIQGIQDFLNSTMMGEPRMFQTLADWIIESTTVGTGFVKAYWDVRKRRVRGYEAVYDGMTGQSVPHIVDTEVIDYTGTIAEVLRTEDLFFPPEAWNCSDFLDQAQWVAQRWRARWPELLQKAEDGIYRKEAVEFLRGAQDQTDTSEGSPYIDPKSRDSADVQPPLHENSNELVLYEIYAKFALNDGDPEQDCVFVYSYKHDALLRAVYQPNFHGRCPFVKLPYWPVPNSAFGRGLPEELRHPQQTANDVVNSVIDALTLSNTPAVVSGKEVGVKPGKNDRIWPGRWITLDQPEQFRPVTVGQVSPNSMDILAMVDKLGMRASSLNDNVLMGGEGASGNRETLGGAQQRAGNATPMFDVILDQIRSAVSRLAEIILINFQQFAPKGQKYLSSVPSGQAMEKFLQLPVDSLVGKYKFKITISTAGANSETRKQSLMEMLQAIKPLFQQMGEIVGQLSMPNTPPAVGKVMENDIRVTLQIMRQVAQTYDMPGADRLLPTWEELWGGIQPLVEQAKQAAQQQPPPLDPSVQRHVYAAFPQLSAMEQVQVLKAQGIEPGKTRQMMAEQEASGGAGLGNPQTPQPPPGMGGAGPQGPPGMPGAFPPMPGGTPFGS